uniref:hypothetical protein n=1 Tax=Alcanivorax nanhaiticus TaxID=1177154 RepID=UPI001E5764F5|nr:hypothetical protein [Alcanivorax nanhaiticus]|tara:strand:- start:7755 stop:7958 length:204 start_codon:yes stop_codon:yes gene_type:complete
MTVLPEKISYEEMLQQLESKGIKVVDGARRLYAALNNGVAADVNGTTGPVRIKLVDGAVVVEEQTLH